MPRQIQWLPPGWSEAWAGGLKLEGYEPQPGERSHFKLWVHEGWVEKLNADLKTYRQWAREGLSDQPFIDLDHRSALLKCIGEPACWPDYFFWGGPDKLTGGIRVRVLWNAKILRHLHFTIGCQYRCVSPVLRLEDPTQLRQRLGSTWVNVGGLVAESAVKGMAPILPQ